ncbi:MAG: transketolase family protein, partial [Geminicoccales bacterium]
VANSTYTEDLQKVAPDRFVEGYIAEQNMLGMAVGMQVLGKIVFPATFAAFFTRAYDFIRMAAISRADLRLSGSHAGVSIGEDGPSQMALEDLALFRAVPGCAVVYPCDAVSAELLVLEMVRHRGMAYMRTSRPKTPVIYGPEEQFPIGGSKVLRQSAHDEAAIAAAGVTVFQALDACDQLKAEGLAVRVIDVYSVQPIDAKTLIEAARAAGGTIITVEDHYPAGGLGDAVSAAIAPEGYTVHRLAVRDIPRSGEPDELLDRFGISARHIADAVRASRRAAKA